LLACLAKASFVRPIQGIIESEIHARTGQSNPAGTLLPAETDPSSFFLKWMQNQSFFEKMSTSAYV
jgi:hypothetical protein